MSGRLVGVLQYGKETLEFGKKYSNAALELDKVGVSACVGRLCRVVGVKIAFRKENSVAVFTKPYIDWNLLPWLLCCPMS